MKKQPNKREKALESVRMWQGQDWELENETPEYFLLKKNTASVGIHLVLALFTMGIGNIFYHLISKKTKKIFI